jgi:O-antigen ligase
MHNCFCQVILLTGLPGFLLVLAWTLLLVVRMVRVFFSRADAVPLHLAFLSIPLTGMLLYNQMEYELFPAWDSSTKAFLLIAGVFLGLYREYCPEKAKAPVPETEAE